MPKEDRAKVKMTVIQFETESDNATLQENVRAITNTLARALAPQPRVIQAPQQIANGNGNNDADNAKSSEQGSLFDNDVDAIDVDVTPLPSKAKPKNTSARQYPTPEILDIDLETADISLKTFIEQKKPSSNNKRYLAIAYWLKKYRSINDITMHHVYTCYRFLSWKVPKDTSQPLRLMKTQGWMNKGQEAGAYSINHVGENVVNEMGG
ncbi:MAG: hypothetical protein M3388_01250 [Acidobacteriota bacterium]|nr:hypothetical protein [Acidobacteriota bacterium]